MITAMLRVLIADDHAIVRNAVLSVLITPDDDICKQIHGVPLD